MQKTKLEREVESELPGCIMTARRELRQKWVGRVDKTDPNRLFVEQQKETAAWQRAG